MNILFWILASTTLVSLLAFVGILVLLLKEKQLGKILLVLVALSAGALIGGAFIHLLPEALEQFDGENIFLYVLVGFALFFFIEKILHWQHCHRERCTVHTFAYMNLFGDGLHNFIDGMIIAAGYIVSIPIGIATTVAVCLHEIPQEIGDFGVLVYGGFPKFKALLINFICACVAVLGGLAGYLLAGYTEVFSRFLLPFAAGGFLYIAASDLIPELRKEARLRESLTSFIIFLLGIGLMYVMKFIVKI